jgi:hypothetical protein
MAYDSYRYFRAGANGTNAAVLDLSKGQGEGIVHSVLVNSDTTGGTVKIVDDIVAGGTVAATISTGASQPFSAILDLQLNKGLTIVIAGFTNALVTVTYR